MDSESLAVVSGISVMTDHNPKVPMYNSHYKSMPVRSVKHKSKLKAFDFELIYEAVL